MKRAHCSDRCNSIACWTDYSRRHVWIAFRSTGKLKKKEMVWLVLWRCSRAKHTSSPRSPCTLIFIARPFFKTTNRASKFLEGVLCMALGVKYVPRHFLQESEERPQEACAITHWHFASGTTATLIRQACGPKPPASGRPMAKEFRLSHPGDHVGSRRCRKLLLWPLALGRPTRPLSYLFSVKRKTQFSLSLTLYGFGCFE